MSVPAFQDIAKAANDVRAMELREASLDWSLDSFVRERHFSRASLVLSRPTCFANAAHPAPQQGLLPPVRRHHRGQEQHPQQCCLQGHWQEQPRQCHQRRDRGEIR
ncbi:hypothetical protein BT67DRAFT_438173 [Trichocladium antarcticum]|uniref:Uncharacterized protein n=1 Tax=Trichocladium antarcticum TaxID=1450529 RepID=A0AAN6UTT7_9PEZI|nr:hypothetical protein BT67DRAFT_438173 [Trichocladium antarcticum]